MSLIDIIITMAVLTTFHRVEFYTFLGRYNASRQLVANEDKFSQVVTSLLLSEELYVVLSLRDVLQ